MLQSYCEEPSLLLKVKELIVWFCHTLSVSLVVVAIVLVCGSNLTSNMIIVTVNLHRIHFFFKFTFDTNNVFLSNFQGFGFNVNKIFDVLLEMR